MKQWPGVFFLVLGLDVVLTVAATLLLVWAASPPAEQRDSPASVAGPASTPAMATLTASPLAADATTVPTDRLRRKPASPPPQAGLSLERLTFCALNICSVVSGLILVSMGISTIALRVDALPAIPSNLQRPSEWTQAYRGALLVSLLGAALIALSMILLVGRL